MTTVAVVYHSGYGHTQAVAEAVAVGIQSVPGAQANLIPTGEAENASRATVPEAW